MRSRISMEPSQHGVLTRRRILHALAAGSLVASPLLSRATFASETAKRADMVAAIFFDSYATEALRRALRYAGDHGFVASLPQLLHARVGASYDNIIWNTWFTANSEESLVTTPQKNHVVVTVHGGGIFASPKRMERSFRADLSRSNPEGLTGQYAAKISDREARALLAGSLPDGSEIALYSFDEFRRGVVNLPMRYGVILDLELAKKSKTGYERFDVLRDDPTMIVRAGGVEAAAAYLEKAQRRNNTESMGHSHPFHRVDPDQPQTRILNLGGNRGGVGSEGRDMGLGWGYGEDWGISGNNGLVDMARYVAVAPGDTTASPQQLDFRDSFVDPTLKIGSRSPYSP